MYFFNMEAKLKKERTSFTTFRELFKIFATFLTLLCLEGMCHGMNIFLKAYNIKKVLSVHALIGFTVFGVLVDEKIKLKVLACSFETTH
jgi:hypothetical protein